MNTLRLCHKGYTPRHERFIKLSTLMLILFRGEGADNFSQGLIVKCYSHQGSQKSLYFVKDQNDVLFNNEKCVVYISNIPCIEEADQFTIERIEWEIAQPYIDTYIFYKEKNGIYN